jgi:hypothetical protein
MYIKKNQVMWLSSYGYGCDAHRGDPPEGTFRLPFGRSCFRGPHYHVLLSVLNGAVFVRVRVRESDRPPLYLKIVLAPRSLVDAGNETVAAVSGAVCKVHIQ